MSTPTVFLVDDDPGIRSSIATLLEIAQLKCECFSSAEDFLSACKLQQEACLLLDVRMPGMSGPELQEELARRKMRMPIIFLTAYADLRTGIEAMKLGAMDFLTKPINGALLRERVQAALASARGQIQSVAARSAFETRLSKLTLREREVLALALSGMRNRDISAYLQVSQRTIENHRAQIHRKTAVISLLELTQQAVDAGVTLGDILPYPAAAS